MADTVGKKLERLKSPTYSVEEDSLKRCVDRLRLGSPVSAQGNVPNRLRRRFASTKTSTSPILSNRSRIDIEWEEERQKGFQGSLR